MTYIQAIQDYFYTCPMIKDTERIYVDYLPEGANEYAIYGVPNPNDGVLKTYQGGTTLEVFNFIFASKFNYSTASNLKNIQNSDFFLELRSWVKDNNRNKVFPAIDGAYKVTVLNTGNLSVVDPSMTVAEYQMSLRVEYINNK